MRFTQQQKEETTAMLLDELCRHPKGLSTSELTSLPQFQGLSNRQVVRLLKASGEATAKIKGAGMRTCYVWRWWVRAA
jgi:hypothetical protein